jgi:hypothetical protein
MNTELDTPRTDEVEDGCINPVAWADFARQLEQELAEITKQRNKLIEVLKYCENYLKPHEKGVCDEESDESGWILLCHIRLILAEIERKKL